MFYSVAIPAILTTRPAGTPVEVAQRKERYEQTGQTQQREKAHAGMTTEQSGDSQVSHAARRASSADEARALSVLYEQFKRPIHSYIYRLLGNQEDADDVTQEVFVRACTSWNGLYERDNLSAWLYRIATNLCVDMLRRRKRISWRSLTPNSGQEDRFDGMSDDGSYLLPDSGGIPEVAEREHIRQALASIPEEYAVALTLSAAQGIPYQEVATILNISPNAAATRISRAKRMFAEQYQRISKQGVGKQEHTL
ncbi:MAG TPA: RNA polymerase sigma factor [Ktedonobacteraceae bacterium]|nr:RNA polymerase sigma factor [Ktedonobacteraceae bacterium]